MFRKTILTLVVLFSGACAVGPDYSEPTLDMPTSFVESLDRPETQEHDPAWWHCFEDPVLDKLIDQTIQRNNTIRQALARVNESRALRQEAFLELLPGGAANAEYIRFRNSSRGQFSGFGPGSGEQNFVSFGLDASWEIDIFGGLRRALEQRSAEQQMLEFELADVLRVVIAEVVRNYVELRGAQARLNVATGNAELQRSTAKVTTAMAEEGAFSEFESARSYAQLKTTEAEIPLLEAEVKIAVNALAVLTVRPIEDLRQSLLPPATLEACQLSHNIGLPSDLLRRRPDVRAAERRLAAATAGIGQAMGEFFPKFTLAGGVAYEAQELDDLGDGDEGYLYGPSISWPILTFGRIRARVMQADARAEQALQAYEGTVLTAVKEAEDAIVRLKGEGSRLQHLREAVKASQSATMLARSRYQLGEIDFLTILDVQRVQLESERTLSLSERDLGLAAIGLYKALGGGWDYATIGDLRTVVQNAPNPDTATPITN